MKKILTESLILVVFSSLIVFYQFNKVPKKISWDEVEFTRLALTLENKPYTPYSQLATGHSTLYFYIILASFKIFGVNNFALRLPAALFGILNVLIFYFVVRLSFNKIKYFDSYLPLVLSLILITLRWYFNFARFSFEATFLLFVELMAVYFFLKLFVIKRYLFVILSGIFSGLAFLSYYPGRIFFLLPLTFLFFYSRKFHLEKYLLIFLLSFFIAASPLVLHFTTNKDQRIQEQLFLTDKKLKPKEKLFYFGKNVMKISFMFNLYGDLNGRHNYPGKPILNPIIGAFFLFGFLVTILNLKKFMNQFFLFYFILSLIPAIFTYPIENPNNLRTYTAIIPSLYFVGGGIIYLLQSENKSKILLFGTIFGLILLLTLSSLYDLRTYFLYQKHVFTKSFELNGSIQRILNLKLWEKTNSL